MREIYFLCSPNLGILDSWLPVLYKLHKEGFSLVCIVPKAGTVSSFNLDNVLVKISLKIFDQIIYRTYSDYWATSQFSSVTIRANSLTRFKVLYIKLKALSSKNFLLLPFIKCMRYIILIMDKAKLKNLDKDISLDPENSVLLYDIIEESKSYNFRILQELQNIPKFSLGHGINLGYENIPSGPVHKNKIINTMIFSCTVQSKNQYIEFYQSKSNEVKVVGVPKYEKWWIDKILNETSPMHKSGYVFIISRSSNSYFSPKMKFKVAKDIKKFVIDKMGLKLIIKRHPKEIIGDSVFEDVFGTENYGNTWEYSEQHAFSIGKKCLFAISFFSGVVVDMLAINIPTIEYIDLKNLVEFDNESSLRVRGEPVLGYRYCGLTLGASNSAEFEICLNEITNNFDMVVKRLTTSFNKMSFYNKDSTNLICSNIIKELEYER